MSEESQNNEYDRAVQALYDIPRFRKKTDQKHINRLLESLGNPQDRFRSVHVAGTNGKGSVCAYLSAVCRDQGCVTGVFTSPHLVDIRERFVIDGHMMDRKTFVKVYELVKEKVDRFTAAGENTTFFEFIFSMAVVWFAQSGVDIAVMEAGMGGKSDTTNCLNPVLSVITAVGMDHMAYLGDTIEKIAAEKAGIMKPGVPCVVSEQSDEVLDVIRKQARSQDCTVVYCNDCDVRDVRVNSGGIDFSMHTQYDDEDAFFPYHTDMTGLYQVDNLVCALMAGAVLFKKKPGELAKSCASVVWAGRMEMVKKGVYVDGAHNPQAMRSFRRTLEEAFAGPKTIVYAVASDKDDTGMVRELARIPDSEYVITMLYGSRQTDSEKVKKAFEDAAREIHRDIDIRVIPDMDEAIRYAWNISGRRVFFVGSLYMAGEVKSLRWRK